MKCSSYFNLKVSQLHPKQTLLTTIFEGLRAEARETILFCSKYKGLLILVHNDRLKYRIVIEARDTSFPLWSQRAEDAAIIKHIEVMILHR